jgi:putative addiction module killer protein
VAKNIELFVTPSGSCPFNDWYESLPKGKRSLVASYIERVARGGAKNNIRALGDSLFEIKIRSEGGLRIYLGEEGNMLILLLVGGDKSSQQRDIDQARKLWRGYGQS